MTCGELPGAVAAQRIRREGRVWHRPAAVSPEFQWSRALPIMSPILIVIMTSRDKGQDWMAPCGTSYKVYLANMSPAQTTSQQHNPLLH